MSGMLLSVLRDAINSSNRELIIDEVEQLRSDTLIVQQFISQHVKLSDFGNMNKSSEMGALYRLFSFLEKMTRH